MYRLVRVTGKRIDENMALATRDLPHQSPKVERGPFTVLFGDRSLGSIGCLRLACSAILEVSDRRTRSGVPGCSTSIEKCRNVHSTRGRIYLQQVSTWWLEFCSSTC
jgi:hypothetical protein